MKNSMRIKVYDGYRLDFLKKVLLLFSRNEDTFNFTDFCLHPDYTIIEVNLKNKEIKPFQGGNFDRFVSDEESLNNAINQLSKLDESYKSRFSTIIHVYEAYQKEFIDELYNIYPFNVSKERLAYEVRMLRGDAYLKIDFKNNLITIVDDSTWNRWVGNKKTFENAITHLKDMKYKYLQKYSWKAWEEAKSFLKTQNVDRRFGRPRVAIDIETVGLNHSFNDLYNDKLLDKLKVMKNTEPLTESKLRQVIHDMWESDDCGNPLTLEESNKIDKRYLL